MRPPSARTGISAGVVLGVWFAVGGLCLAVAGPDVRTARAQSSDTVRAQVPDSASLSPPASASPPAAAPPPTAQPPAAPVPGARPRAIPAPTPHTAVHEPLRSVPTGARPTRTSGMCGVCHSDIRVQYDKGIHKSEEVGCVSCHGGDPAAITVAGAHRGQGYRGKPRRRDIPALCASCHSDVVLMRPYNLPADQYAQYKTSQHGIALAKGDESVAVCTDCHGEHEIRPGTDPKSLVAKRSIPATCGRCHGDAGLMARHGIRENVYADYQAGIHGRALLLDGNDAAPHCASCHGSHGAAPPGLGNVDKVCGQCHAKTRVYFLASVHRGSIERGRRSECIACHDNHKTAEPRLDSFDVICRDCHEPGAPEWRVAGRIRAMLASADEAIQQAHHAVERAASIPINIEDYESRLEDARTALLEAVPVTHTVDTTQVEPHARRARSIASEVSREVDEKLSGRWWRYVGLGLFWFYLFLTAAIVVRARRREAKGREP
jgi:predicted CXXCH cytochrome family protein